MIQAPSILEELQAKQVTLSLNEQGKIAYTAPNGVMTPALIELIRQHKAELLAALQVPSAAPVPLTLGFPVLIAYQEHSPYGEPPLVCRKCHNTRKASFQLNLLRNRWVCCECGTLHALLIPPVKTITGEDAITEAVKFLDMLTARGVTVRRYESGQYGVAVPPDMTTEQFNELASSVVLRDAMLRRLIPEHPGAPEPSEQEPPAAPDTEPLPALASAARQDEAAPALGQAPGESEGTRESVHAAVLHNAGVSWLDNAGKLRHAPAPAPITYERLADIALEQGIRNLWVTPGCSFSEYVFDHPTEFLQGTSTEHKTIVRTRDYGGQAYPTMASVNKLLGAWPARRIVYIHFPQFDNRWADDKVNGWTLADVENPKTLLAALYYLFLALGVDIGAPGYTGIELMKETNSSAARVPFVRQADLSVLPEHREIDLQFCRPLTEQEQAQGFLHIYDRNSMYLAAATGAEMGEGAPDYIGTSIDTLLAWEKRPTGVWHIIARAPAAPDMRLMEIVSQFMNEGEQWAYTPAVETFLALGYSVEFVDAWVWRKTHRTLQPWGKLIWDTRQALRSDRARFPNEQGAETARQMIKRLATQGVGWLDLQNDRKKVPTPQWHRPDYKNMIVSLARFRMVLKILECIKAGYYPVFGYTDGIAFVSDEAAPALAVPGLMLVTDKQGVTHDRSNELGGFKCEHTFTLDREIVALLSGQLAPYQVKQELNARGGN